MKRLITILISAVAAVALLVGGTAYAGKPGTTHTTTPTPNVVMESGSGTLPLYTLDSDAGTYSGDNATYFPTTFNPITSPGGYGEVVHVTLTWNLNDTNTSESLNGLHLQAVTLCDDSMNTNLNQEITLDLNYVGGTIEFDAYDAWGIDFWISSSSAPTGTPYISYNYTVTYPAQ